jgi:hypothetical protein
MKKSIIMMTLVSLTIPLFDAGMGWCSAMHATMVRINGGLEGRGQEKEAVHEPDETKKHLLIFAVFAETSEQLDHARILARSIRTFAGRLKEAPVWIYMPEALYDTQKEVGEEMDSLEIEFLTSRAPSAALEYYFARKVFASADAEKKAEGQAEYLAWLDEDTVVLREPGDFILKRGVSLGYRPVMHRLIGSSYSDEPDPFWKRVFTRLSVPETAVFPMVTPADQATIRPYFNAGLLVVRPERSVLRKWAECFPRLYEDPELAAMCSANVRMRIFLHQAALAGAVLNLLKREEMVELSTLYNYPLFFHEKFDSKKKFDSIEEAVTIRYDVYFRNPSPDWSKNLKGPRALVAWLEDSFPE